MGIGLRVILLWLTGSLPLSAELVPARLYTTADGLPRNNVCCIVQDTRGYVWMGTSDGLARFDGYGFRNYGKEDGLPSGAISGLLVSRGGTMWVGTGGGLARFRGEASESSGSAFQPVPLGNSSNRHAVDSIYQGPSGTILIGTLHGLFRVADTGAGMPVEVEGPFQDSHITALHETGDGVLWIGTYGAGLYRRGLNGGISHHPSDVIAGFLEDSDGVLWAATLGSGLARLVRDPVPERSAVDRMFTSKDGLPSNRVEAIYQTSDGRRWLIAQTLLEWKQGRDGRSLVLRPYDRRHGVYGGSGTGLFEDRGHNLWLGVGGGAVRLSLHGFTTYDESDGMRRARIRALFEDREGALIAVTEQVWLDRFDGRRFLHVEPNLGEGGVYPKWGWGWRQTVLQSRDGEWWIPTEAGLYRFPAVARMEELAHIQPKARYTTRDGLPGDAVFRLYEDSHGDIWIGTIYGKGDGLTRWERRSERLIRHKVLPSSHELPMGPPTAVLEDAHGAIWVGFYRGGLARYRDGKFHYFDGQAGAPMAMIGSILSDRKGRLWIGSRAGLTRVDNPAAEKPAFVTLTAADGLTRSQFGDVTEDRWGRIYACEPSGIDRFDPDRPLRPGSVRHFTTADGLARGEMPVAYRDRHGRLWFGTHEGLSVLDPEPPGGSEELPIFISALHVAHRPSMSLGWGAAEIRDLLLPPDQNHVLIDFVHPSSGPADLPLYQYRLDGAGAEWSAPSDVRSVHLPGLAPGDYRFSVRAVGAGGMMSKTPATVSFRVDAPLWRKAWFIGLILLMAGSASYVFLRYRRSQTLAMERVRMSIASDLHDDLGASLSQIAILSEVARVGRQNGILDEVLARIGSLARETVASTSDLVWAIRPQEQRLAELSDRIREYADDLLSSKSIELRYAAPISDLDIRISPEVRQQVFLILKEAIRNAARHSGCSSVGVSLSVQSGWIVLAVQDDGRGMPPNPSNAGNGVHHGLMGMRWRATNLGGRLHIDTKPGEGVLVRLEAPVQRRPLLKLAGISGRWIP